MKKSRIKGFFDPVGVTIGSATPQIFDDFIEELQHVGLNGSSQQRYYAAIKQCLDTAVRKEYIVRNPLDRVDRPKRNKFYPSFYNEAEAKKILECAKDDPCYFPILLAVYYGLRRSDAYVKHKQKNVKIRIDVLECCWQEKTEDGRHFQCHFPNCIDSWPLVGLYS